jgi:hypothetical protein
MLASGVRMILREERGVRNRKKTMEAAPTSFPRDLRWHSIEPARFNEN